MKYFTRYLARTLNLDQEQEDVIYYGLLWSQIFLVL